MPKPNTTTSNNDARNKLLKLLYLEKRLHVNEEEFHHLREELSRRAENPLTTSTTHPLPSATTRYAVLSMASSC